MLRPIAVRFGFAAVIAAALRSQSPSPLFRVLEEHVPYDFRPLAALDVDVDGDQDLICREGVLLNDGTGRFASTSIAPNLQSELFYSVAIATPDFDGDGFADLLVKAPSTSGNQLFAFVAATGGLAPLTVAFPSAVPTWFVPIDYDGDGDDDLAVGGTSAQLPPNGTQIWLNGAGLSFTAQTGLLPTGLGSTNVVAVGDFDGDGDDDVFSAGLVLSSARFYLNSAGSFALVATTTLPALLTVVSGSATGDFDGDGADDVVLRVSGPATTPGPAADVGLRCVGGTPSTTVEFSANAASGFAALDLNGDGQLDRAESLSNPAVTAPQPSLEIRSGAPLNSPLAAPPMLAFADGPAVKFSFDADGDGDLDLLCTRANRTPRVLYNDGAGGLYEARGDASFAVASGTANAALLDVVVGDFDGDGDVDLARYVHATCPEAPFAVLRNDGHGRFPPSSTPAACPSTFPHMGLAADFDADGRDDIFRVSQPGSSIVAFHRSLVGGGFASATVATESGVATDLVVRDLDGDGDVDAAACFGGSDLLVRYLNDGTGGFVRAALPSGAAPTGLRVADMNGDGAVDFVLATAAGVRIVDGATSISTVAVAVAGEILERAEAGDLDADGDADLLVDGRPFLQAGDGTFFSLAPLPSFPLPNAGPTLPQTLLDVDGDGDLDALAYGSLWLNYAGLMIGPEPVPFPTVAINQIAQTGFMPFYRWADFDRDGDPDLLDPTGRLIANVARHLSRGAPAAIGRVGTLDVRGPTAHPFALFASASAYEQNPYFVPGWGNLFLVPNAAVFAGDGVFDANAGAAVPFAVPNVPALVGLDLYWQAVLPLAGAFTNVERTRILSL